MNASHSGAVIFISLCDSYMGRPVYFCGPPAAQQTISVTRYLNPAGGVRWCASFTRGLAFSRGSDHDAVDEVVYHGCDVIDATKSVIKRGFSGNCIMNFRIAQQRTETASKTCLSADFSPGAYPWQRPRLAVPLPQKRR